jgi:site-specific recombinase XerD
MDVVYLFYESGAVRIPFYEHDDDLFRKLIASYGAYWDNYGHQFIIPQQKYNDKAFGLLLSRRFMVKVSPEALKPVRVRGFRFGQEPSGQDLQDQFPHYYAPGMFNSASDLPVVFSDFFSQKLEMELVIRKYSIHTRKAYLSHNQDLCQWLQKEPHDVTGEDIKQYLAYREKKDRLSAAWINLAVSSFRFFYRYVHKRDIAKEAYRPRKDKHLPVVLSTEEIRRIFQAEANIKHRLLLMLVYSSGLRVSEVIILKRQDLDLDRKLLLVSRAKGRKDRYTILSDVVIDCIKKYFYWERIATWVFPGAEPGKHLSTRSAQYIFEHSAQKAGIIKDASIHSLRHSFATHLLENGTDIRYIQELMGHATLRTTERYTHVARRNTLKIQSPLDTIYHCTGGSPDSLE